MMAARNALILKGDIPGKDTLYLLEELLDEVCKRNHLSIAPQPYELFSFIGGSGGSRDARNPPYFDNH